MGAGLFEGATGGVVLDSCADPYTGRPIDSDAAAWSAFNEGK